MGKRLLILVFLGSAVWLLSGPRTEAAGCRAFVKRVAVVEKVNVVAPVVASFVPVPVLQYSATYAPGVPYSGPPAPVAGQSQDAVLQALQRLEQRLAGLERRAGVAPQEAPPMRQADEPPPAQGKGPAGSGGGHAAMFSKSCVVCHEASVAKRDGGGFTLMTGTTVAPLTDRQKLRIIERVRSGTMPPPDAVKAGKVKAPTDEDFDAALSDLVR